MALDRNTRGDPHRIARRPKCSDQNEIGGLGQIQRAHFSSESSARMSASAVVLGGMRHPFARRSWMRSGTVLLLIAHLLLSPSPIGAEPAGAHPHLVAVPLAIWALW